MHRSSFILTSICFSDILAIFITFGDQYSLVCHNNYISNITCSLNISAESQGNASSYWVHFSSYNEEHDCTLTRRQQSLLCELDLSHEGFTDTDHYTFSLRSGNHGNNFSIIGDGAFTPKDHIRPVPPSDLSLLREHDSVVFQWQSGYDPDNSLISHLQYQLSVYSEHKLYEVESADLKVYVEESRFEPHTNYTVRVRSRPDQTDYDGVWSLWAPVLNWRSGYIHKETPETSYHIAWYFLPLPFLLVLLPCIPYARWRKDDYIPSPAPYFRDWDIDAQICSMLSGKTGDVMQGEESLQIDILTESTDTPPHLTMGTDNQDDPTPQSPCMPQSPVGSEVDSGCWIRDFVATERGSITCSEDYCMLSNSHTNAI
ncbi:interleukin-4 receptor subunit alpha [Pseudorasbora parva]|uniref:interleukin-4 receptor subunit alpha n=1 Tax=Pseudorasbora parva TaxID=51549 RepID=UPI00351F75F8